jgi:hypothetical protein
MVSRRTAVAFAVGSTLLLLVGAFAFVDFSAAEHRTSVDQQVSTATANDTSLSVPSEVVLYVFGPDSVSDRTETAIATALEQRGTSVRVVSHLDPVYDDPVLVAGIEESQVSYNPLTPSAEVALSFLYAPGGTVTQFGQPQDDANASFNASLLGERLLDDEPILFRIDDQNRLFRKGRVRLTDATTGIISWPAYRTHVVETLAERSVDAVLSPTS